MTEVFELEEADGFCAGNGLGTGPGGEFGEDAFGVCLHCLWCDAQRESDALVRHAVRDQFEDSGLAPRELAIGRWYGLRHSHGARHVEDGRDVGAQIEALRIISRRLAVELFQEVENLQTGIDEDHAQSMCCADSQARNQKPVALIAEGSGPGRGELYQSVYERSEVRWLDG